MVLNKLIFLKEQFSIFHLEGCGGLERTDFQQFLQCVVSPFFTDSTLAEIVLKKLIFISFYFGRVWWS